MKRIKKLLVSRKWGERCAGLELLDEAYRTEIGGRLRCWSDANNLGLTPCDIADIWQVTVRAVATKVENGTFEFDGRLDGLLSKIARRRAIDLLRRRRINIDQEADPATVPAGPSHIDWELLEEVEFCFDKLSEKLKLVLRIDVMLCFNSGGKWVSLGELTNEINMRCGLSLPESTVRSRRERGRNELRELLKRRGYGG